ncbi:MAG TPA: hypothetical protein VFJ97_03770 [Dermatophilaceae bacterium]|nr:hypothetical protein [Dermatophilaceae bacterium]
MSDHPTQRLTGPNPGAIVLGLAALVLSGLAIAREVTGFEVDWGSFGPGAIIAAGALLLVLGVVGLTRRAD